MGYTFYRYGTEGDLINPPWVQHVTFLNGTLTDPALGTPSAKTTHMAISRRADVNGRASLSFVLAVLPGSGPANCVMPRNPLVLLTRKRKLVKPPVCIDVLSLM